jgi:CBS domain-containing protein
MAKLDICALKLGDVLKKDGELICCDDTISIGDAMKAMEEANILSMPVVKNDDLIGTVDVFDIMQYMAFGVCEQGATELDEKHKAKLTSTALADLLGHTRESDAVWSHTAYSSETTLGEVARPFMLGIHRVFVKTADGLRVVSQSDVARYLHNHLAELDSSVMGKTLGACGWGEGNINCISETDQALKGFRMMVTRERAAVGVTKSDGTLVANLSASDLRGFRRATIDEIFLSVVDFVKNRRGGVYILPEVEVCTVDTTVRDAISAIVKHHIHRLWLVDSDRKPKNLISLSMLIGLFAPVTFSMPDQKATI